MKKLITITVLMALAMSVKAQDIYYVGYYKVSYRTYAALYKNGERLCSVQKPNLSAKALYMTCDSENNIYWWIELRNTSDETLHHIEIWKNDQMYLSTENLSDLAIYNMYCLNDTLYYVGFQRNENAVAVATVWKGPDFTPYYVLGDGIHTSVIYDADVDKDTNTPYFCGYMNDSLQKACVWEASELLYKQEPSGSQRGSWATEISVDNGEIYTNGWQNYETGREIISWATIWKDNNRVQTSYADFIYYDFLYAYQGNFYYKYLAPHGYQHWIFKNQGGIMQLPGQAYVQRICSYSNDIYMLGELNNKGCIWKNFEVYQQYDNSRYLTDMVLFPSNNISQGSEWYYEIQNNDGSITYQHLECVGDTLFDRAGKRPKVIVRSNTHYDRDTITEVTHEYIYEEYGTVYWWNRDLQEFTTLYNLAANAGDEWEIKVGNETITMHVDAIENVEYEGHTYRTLHVSDPDDLFSGDIVCGFGHMTSFFPEQLMNRGKDFTVNGLRCYWIGDELIYHNGEEDCDAIHSELQSLDETDIAAFTVYPNPATGVLFVRTHAVRLYGEYRITNLMGQTVLSGAITAENQRIDIADLPAGMYFISLGDTTRKFVVRGFEEVFKIQRYEKVFHIFVIFARLQRYGLCPKQGHNQP